jgi:HEAT repeat protein
MPVEPSGGARAGAPMARTPVRELRVLLSSTSRRERTEAAWKLAEREDAAAARLLVTALAQGALPAAVLVDLLGAPWAVDQLVAALDHAEQHQPGGRPPRRPPLRVSLARALGAAGDPAALDSLRAMEATTEDGAERRAARRAIRRIRSHARVVA